VDGSGAISQEELTQALNRAQINSELASKIMNQVDYDGDGNINYSEFLSSTLVDSLNDQNLLELFIYLDCYK
jgi:Ca2+-binding EF-hand superfamily protein